MLIPQDGKERRTYTFSFLNMKFFSLLFFITSFCVGYFLLDYLELRSQRTTYTSAFKELKFIKSEARILNQNLETLKRSLTDLKSYTKKIHNIVNVKIDTVESKTGIGPVDIEEHTHGNNKVSAQNYASVSSYPIGLKLEDLSLNQIFQNVDEAQSETYNRNTELQKLLTSLSRKKSLLASIPMTYPAKGWLTSGYGKRAHPFTGELTQHRGLDIAASIGTPIYAPADGVVIYSGKKIDFGNIVMIAHYDNGIVTKYAHNSENLVSVGQRVSRGDHIASIGLTGKTTGPHLHYEVWVNGRAVNPMKFILDTNLVNF